jgi:antitoxin component YwqK of YwqJK toxin-antitoxin module
MVGEPEGMRLGAFAVAALFATAASAQNLAVEGSCRDGLAHGAYELKGAGGQVRVVGAFSKGRRTGSFLFWSSAGVRIAQLPYDDDVLSGTLALWYAMPGRGGEPVRKLEAVYARGRLAGLKRSWYPDGRLRAEFRYDRGALASARAFTEAGKTMPDADARAMADRDQRTDDAYFASLDAMVRANLPRCEPATDRLEKG